MKIVYSAGKQVSFRVPKHWEQEPNGNGTMLYDPEPESGTLRLDVLTYREPNTDPNELAKRGNESDVNLNSPPTGETLASGARLVRTRDRFQESGDQLVMETWELTIKETPYILIAIFTFTLLEEQLQDRKYQDQLEMLDREIRVAKIHI